LNSRATASFCCAISSITREALSTPPAAFEAGHIPGAVNVFWKSTLTDAGTLRPPDELRALFPVAPAAHVVVYDDTGMLASWSYFVLRYINLAPALYDGGFEQWKERVVAKPEG